MQVKGFDGVIFDFFLEDVKGEAKSGGDDDQEQATVQGMSSWISLKTPLNGVCHRILLSCEEFHVVFLPQKKSQRRE